jgi:hypothetical protein
VELQNVNLRLGLVPQFVLHTPFEQLDMFIGRVVRNPLAPITIRTIHRLKNRVNLVARQDHPTAGFGPNANRLPVGFDTTQQHIAVG